MFRSLVFGTVFTLMALAVPLLITCLIASAADTTLPWYVPVAMKVSFATVILGLPFLMVFDWVLKRVRRRHLRATVAAIPPGRVAEDYEYEAFVLDGQRHKFLLPV